ncbi:hypothetical protein D3C76_838720 [compost metagenome]
MLIKLGQCALGLVVVAGHLTDLGLRRIDCTLQTAGLVAQVLAEKGQAFQRIGRPADFIERAIHGSGHRLDVRAAGFTGVDHVLQATLQVLQVVFFIRHNTSLAHMGRIKQLAVTRLPGEVVKLAPQVRHHFLNELRRVFHIAMHLKNRGRGEGELLIDLRPFGCFCRRGRHQCRRRDRHSGSVFHRAHDRAHPLAGGHGQGLR